MEQPKEYSGPRCWNCGSIDIYAGGQDGDGQEILVCGKCNERQEEE